MTLSRDSKNAIIAGLIAFWIITIGVVSLIERRWRLEYLELIDDANSLIEDLEEEIASVETQLDQANASLAIAEERGVESEYLLEEADAILAEAIRQETNVETLAAEARDQLVTIREVLAEAASLREGLRVMSANIEKNWQRASVQAAAVVDMLESTLIQDRNEAEDNSSSEELDLPYSYVEHLLRLTRLVNSDLAEIGIILGYTVGSSDKEAME